MVGGSTQERRLLNMSATSLAKMVELHYELKHMHDIERRQVEEIDRGRERFKDSENKLHHLGQIREALELTIVELKKELADSRQESSRRQDMMNGKARQIVMAEDDFKVVQQVNNKKMAEAAKKKDEEIEAVKALFEKTKEENRIMLAKVAGAERGAAALKEVIGKCA